MDEIHNRNNENNNEEILDDKTQIIKGVDKDWDNMIAYIILECDKYLA